VGQPDTAFVGSDVSKAALDACLLGPDGRVKEAAFANDADGHAALIAWADRHAGGAALHFCLEATDPYSDPPASRLLCSAAEHGR
jgi:transposase